MPAKKSYHYPWRNGNRFTLLVDGDEYFPAMLAAIDAAQQFVLLEHYLVESGETTTGFIQAICAARQRQVSVYLLLDDYGSKQLHEADRLTLREAGVEIIFFNPVSIKHPAQSLHRDHRKLLIVDSQVAFVGGAGITDDFNPKLSNHYWHDVMLKIEGPVIQDWQQVFCITWMEQGGTNCLSSPLPASNSFTGDGKARVLVAAGTDFHEINRALISRIRSSHQRVWLTSPYFISTWKIRRAIRYAANKGIDTRLLLPGEFSDHPWLSHGARLHYTRLLKAGVKIFEYQPRFPHAKVKLCDNWVSIGSSNLDRWNQYLNLDANQEIDDDSFANTVQALFTNDFRFSQEITYEAWLKRSYLQRFREWLISLVIAWLGKISWKYRRRNRLKRMK